jgi:crotonobetainyl-CoA:carnitine CoA-transferase CaiB-like acyl-CoA transferase
VTLDLEQEEGLALLWRLVAGADVVIENFTPRVLERFGIVWEDLHARHPGVILVRMPAFGLEGPWRDRAGFAMTIEQTSGLAWVTGYEDLPLVPRGPCDPVGGMHAVLALAGALAVRSRTGEGQLVEVPLLDGALNIAAEQVLEHDRTGEVLTRHGNRSPINAPQGLYPAAGEDRWVAVAVETDEQWRALAALVGARADLDVAARRAAHDSLDQVIGEWTKEREATAAEEVLCAAGVPAAAVALPHLAHRSPQLEHRRFLQELDHAVTGRTGYPGFPMLFSAFGPHLYRSAPPRLGEHNREVLGELGLSDEDVLGLEARRVIGDRPAWIE